MEYSSSRRAPSPVKRIHRRFARLCLAGSLAASFGLLALPALAQAAGATSPKLTSTKFPGITCQVEHVAMRDGNLLTTYVYVPEGGGKYPVIMERTPYGRLGGDACFKGGTVTTAQWAQKGYVGITQEVRGTYTSGGTYNPNVQEAKDGYDAVEWAAKQSWSTGKVGMTGSSYLAITQWEAAFLKPPHLVAIAPNIMGSDYHDNNVYVNAVPNLWLMMSWPAETIVPDVIVRTDVANHDTKAQIAKDVSQWYTLVNEEMRSSWVWDLPLTSFTLFHQYALSFYYQWLAHPSYDKYWAQVDTSTHYHDVQVPSLVSGDWYDPFQVGTIQNYEGMRARGGTKKAREGTHLIMGAYGHSGNSGHPTFGNDTPNPAIKEAFFAHYLKGVDNGYQNSPRVHLYVLVPPNSGNKGSGFWITGSSYPLPGTHTVRYYLHSGGHANTRSGDGRLSTQKHRGRGHNLQGRRADVAVDHFTYDPTNPVPTTGGNMCCDTSLLPAGAQDQNTVEQRNDILVYTSAPLEHDVSVIGTVNASFWAASSAKDTDFTVKLVDVHPDGLTHNVLDRIVRARYRHGSKSKPVLITPHKPYHYTLELGNTATIFRAGHQIRVEISSSNFPHFARNLNTGLNNNDTSKIRIAHQTIFHDPGHPSYIKLPVDPNVHTPAGMGHGYPR